MSNLFSFWGLVVAVLSAAFCYLIASRNNMNKVGWPILGFFLPLIGIVVTFAIAFAKTPDPDQIGR